LRIFTVLISLLFAWSIPSLEAQKAEVVTSEGVAQVEFPDFKSRLEVEKEAREHALVNALENAFGTAIIQGNSTYMRNSQTGKQVETNTVFNMIANTYVKGEVLEILDQSFKEIEAEVDIGGKKKTVRELKCNVRIKARELSEQPIEFTAFPLDCVNERCKTTAFRTDDPLYLFFSSPGDGYLSVFLDDGSVAQCLLPYSRLPEQYQNGVPVSKNKEYVFFSPDRARTYFEDKSYTDSYVLYTSREHEQNRMYILFSTTPLEAPDLDEGVNQQILSDFEKDQGFKVPRAMESEKFQDWLIKSQLRKSDLRVSRIDITISNE
jgi:hypothetical protein